MLSKVKVFKKQRFSVLVWRLSKNAYYSAHLHVPAGIAISIAELVQTRLA